MKTIGIIGGMGPLATVDLFKKIIDYTPAIQDQEHIPVLIANIPQIPDRTAAILGGGKSPVPMVVDAGKRLESIGADFLLLGCNSLHYYYKEIQDALTVPVLNMVDLTCDKAKRLGYRKVAVLGTKGTLKTGLYQKKLEEKGIKNIPVPDDRLFLMNSVIYQMIKAGNFTGDLSEFKDLLKELHGKGAESFILGCTELPILFKTVDFGYPFIDATDILAQTAVAIAKTHD